MKSEPYFTYKNYLKQKYKKPLYSIPIDLDLGCPNRDINGLGGCTFCPSNGARAAQILDATNAKEQIQNAVSFAKTRYNAQKFMLYIQAYTGTFTSVINQKNIYSNLLKEYEFDAISIGTRPDCLNTKTLEYLTELNKQIDVYIDLGVQSLNDDTLKRINRGHDANSSLQAIKLLKKYNIKVYAHIIVGLKGENRIDWENTVKKLVNVGIDGIKIHNLHIIKNTQLAKEYEIEPFKTLNEYEYANEVINLLRYIPNNIPIIRVNTDTSKESLVAPIWNMQKGQFSEYLKESMIYRDILQGDLVENIEKQNLERINSVKLEDGSITLWDKKYKDYYHPKNGAYRSAKELFIKNSLLEELLLQKNVNLLDVGFGIGYNCFEAVKLNKKNKLNITALDKNRAILKYSYENLELDKTHKAFLKSIYETNFYNDKFNSVEFFADDARSSLNYLQKKYDVIFLDSFTHHLNPSLISKEFIKLLSSFLKKDGVLICSNSSDMLKASLVNAGFKWESFDIKRTDIKGLVATFGEIKFSSIMYSDPNLIFSEKEIITFKDSISNA